MGQKINPLGFRVGITKKHQNQWFARFHKHQYAQTVLEDRFLRQTLFKLLPEIVAKQSSRSQVVPKISHIKIERGFIPYEIGIQIHAQNCEMFKSAVEKLQVQPQLIHNVLKNQVLLEQASLKAKEMNSLINNLPTTSADIENKESSNINIKKSYKVKNFQKRKNALKFFQERFLKNIYLLKEGKKISRKFKKTVFKITPPLLGSRSAETKGFASSQSERRSERKSGAKKSFMKDFKTRNFSNSKNFRKDKTSFNKTKNKEISFDSKKTYNTIVKKYGALQSNKMTRFVDLFVAQTNRKFINALKTEMNYWNKFLKNHKQQQIQKYGFLKEAPVGYQKKWSLIRLQKIKTQKTFVLIKLLKSLQKQALKKFENLRQEYLVLGTLSKTKTFAYFQRIRFIKSLRNYIQQVNKQLKNQKNSKSTELNNLDLQKQQKNLLSLTEIALRKKFADIKNESLKVKFIDFLQEKVKQHRTRNISLYLATLSDSRKNLRKIRKFTKQQANFLFGIHLNENYNNEERRRDVVKNKVLQTIKQINRKNELQKNFQEIFFEQLQKLKTTYLMNLELTPKISFKFYSVKPQNLETKASFVADSIVDDLEKRKAFRRVIKKAKEDLMKTSKVKGVKIQVSGRLNGAEIARSEWVRSGRVPLQTLRANIDYCYKTAYTIYGIIGVKVWIYKGYTK
jgi:ribosomal protein S3|uniref:Small ribosomal subunit protein uS3c n=1 Tax=Hydrodictyon reticulatum TaxID=3107 RepID=A0A1W5RNV6_HYDRE|nr:ribosomal protein S3 [Hydrodictyon reticulatum]AQU64506.1 ribosomal protein S3 [Hydrodictyon reticulatum]